MNNASTITTTANGPTLSRIVAGTWRLASWDMSVAQRIRWIEECLALGITTFDHADIYGKHTVQPLFGEALRMQPALRHRLQIVTKCGIRTASPTDPERRVAHYDTSTAHIERAVPDAVARADHQFSHFGPDANLFVDDFAVCEWTASTDSKEWDGVDVFPLRNGKIARKDVYSASHRARER